MVDETLIKVKGLSKKFCKDLKTSLWYGLKDVFSGIRGDQEDGQLRPKEFWAVKDINFELKRGECLGLIGHNGAGKSTLLKILNGLINPDTGSVTMRGRVGALIELGAGFNPILTGRENIYNNGAVLGFSRKEIEAKIEQIIDFSEIREFIDMPVQNYSSGMKVRLGFAIAAEMEPDILIIDEVLAVGDVGFRLKCFKTMDKILPNTAIIFVSHSMPMVSRICDKMLLMTNGKEQYFGNDTSKAIDQYYSRFASDSKKIVFDDGSLELGEIKLLNSENELNNEAILEWQDDFNLYMKFKVKKKIKVPMFKIVIYDKEQRPVAMLHPNSENDEIRIDDNQLVIRVSHKRIELSKGVYSISMNIFKHNSLDTILGLNDVLTFQMTYKTDYYHPFLLSAEYKN